MPYSTGLKTPLSNFEANSNYKVCNGYYLAVLKVLNFFSLCTGDCLFMCFYVIVFPSSRSFKSYFPFFGSGAGSK